MEVFASGSKEDATRLGTLDQEIESWLDLVARVENSQGSGCHDVIELASREHIEWLKQAVRERELEESKKRLLEEIRESLKHFQLRESYQYFLGRVAEIGLVVPVNEMNELQRRAGASVYDKVHSIMTLKYILSTLRVDSIKDIQLAYDEADLAATVSEIRRKVNAVCAGFNSQARPTSASSLQCDVLEAWFVDKILKKSIDDRKKQIHSIPNSHYDQWAKRFDHLLHQ